MFGLSVFYKTMRIFIFGIFLLQFFIGLVFCSPLPSNPIKDDDESKLSTPHPNIYIKEKSNDQISKENLMAQESIYHGYWGGPSWGGWGGYYRPFYHGWHYPHWGGYWHGYRWG